MIVELSGQWRFDGDGAIDVPGFWEAAGHLTRDGVATYERDVELAEAPPFATLEFDAVADLCEVSVNGTVVGSHEVGFTPFVLDVSGRLRAGTNTLTVEVDDPARGTPEHLDS